MDHGGCWELWEAALLTQDGRNKTPEPLITVASAECAYSGGSCLQSTSPASGRPPEHVRWLIAFGPKRMSGVPRAWSHFSGVFPQGKRRVPVVPAQTFHLLQGEVWG